MCPKGATYIDALGSGCVEQQQHRLDLFARGCGRCRRPCLSNAKTATPPLLLLLLLLPLLLLLLLVSGCCGCFCRWCCFCRCCCCCFCFCWLPAAGAASANADASAAWQPWTRLRGQDSMDKGYVTCMHAPQVVATVPEAMVSVTQAVVKFVGKILDQ